MIIDLKGLPEKSYWFINERQRGHIPAKDRHKYGDVCMHKRGVERWFPTEHWGGRKKAMELNEEIGVTPAMAHAMFSGVLHGFRHPFANPAVYDEDGEYDPIRAMKVLEEEEKEQVHEP